MSCDYRFQTQSRELSLLVACQNAVVGSEGFQIRSAGRSGMPLALLREDCDREHMDLYCPALNREAELFDVLILAGDQIMLSPAPRPRSDHTASTDPS